MDKDKAEITRLPVFEDALSELLRSGARELIMQAVETEMSLFLESHQAHKLADGRQAVGCNPR